MFALRCLFCEHPNPIGAKYCNECGTPLHIQPCGACDAVDSRTATRCWRCGHAFAPVPVQEPGFASEWGIEPGSAAAPEHGTGPDPTAAPSRGTGPDLPAAPWADPVPDRVIDVWRNPRRRLASEPTASPGAGPVTMPPNRVTAAASREPDHAHGSWQRAAALLAAAALVGAAGVGIFLIEPFPARPAADRGADRTGATAIDERMPGNVGTGRPSVPDSALPGAAPAATGSAAAIPARTPGMPSASPAPQAPALTAEPAAPAERVEPQAPAAARAPASTGEPAASSVPSATDGSTATGRPAAPDESSRTAADYRA